jgi:hypothetical protein
MERKTIRVCGQEIDEPGHICAFFTSRDEEYETLLPYLKDGVEDGDIVLSVVDEARLPDHRARLESAGVTVDDEQVTLSTSEATYLANGRFDMDRMVTFVRDQLVEARSKGRCVRTAGWMDWMRRGADGTERAMEYEARMNLLVTDFDCTFMCVYDLASLDGRTVADILATHPYVVLRGQIRQNPFYIPAEVYLREMLSTGHRAAPDHSTPRPS